MGSVALAMAYVLLMISEERDMTNYYAEKAAQNFSLVREKRPLVHNITNYVVMNFTANVLLAMGASPVMAHAEQEVENMVSLAGALVLNIGTLSDSWVTAMEKAGKLAGMMKKPVVLDPVGAGATPYRSVTAKRLLQEANVHITRGNPSEIMALRDEQSVTKGVDTVHSVEEVAAITSLLAKELDTVIAITGKTDFITDGQRVLHVHNGHPLMPFVTGTGCAATAVIGAFAAVDPDPVTAATTGLALLGVAGEKAGADARGPGTFVPALLDALYNITPEELSKECRITDG